MFPARAEQLMKFFRQITGIQQVSCKFLARCPCLGLFLFIFPVLFVVHGYRSTSAVILNESYTFQAVQYERIVKEFS